MERNGDSRRAISAPDVDERPVEAVTDEGERRERVVHELGTQSGLPTDCRNGNRSRSDLGDVPLQRRVWVFHVLHF
jgi:hypothetical protein